MCLLDWWACPLQESTRARKGQLIAHAKPVRKRTPPESVSIRRCVSVTHHGKGQPVREAQKGEARSRVDCSVKTSQMQQSRRRSPVMKLVKPVMGPWVRARRRQEGGRPEST